MAQNNIYEPPFSDGSLSKKISRRDFLKVAGVGTGGLVIAISLDSCVPGAKSSAMFLSEVKESLKSWDGTFQDYSGGEYRSTSAMYPVAGNNIEVFGGWDQTADQPVPDKYAIFRVELAPVNGTAATADTGVHPGPTPTPDSSAAAPVNTTRYACFLADKNPETGELSLYQVGYRRGENGQADQTKPIVLTDKNGAEAGELRIEGLVDLDGNLTSWISLEKDGKNIHLRPYSKVAVPPTDEPKQEIDMFFISQLSIIGAAYPYFARGIMPTETPKPTNTPTPPPTETPTATATEVPHWDLPQKPEGGMDFTAEKLYPEISGQDILSGRWAAFIHSFAAPFDESVVGKISWQILGDKQDGAVFLEVDSRDSYTRKSVPERAVAAAWLKIPSGERYRVISVQIHNAAAPGGYVVMNAIFGPEFYNTRYMPGFNGGTAIPLPKFYLDRNSQGDMGTFIPAYKLAAAGYYDYDRSDKILQQMADTDAAPVDLEKTLVISNFGFFVYQK